MMLHSPMLISSRALLITWRSTWVEAKAKAMKRHVEHRWVIIKHVLHAIACIEWFEDSERREGAREVGEGGTETTI